MNKLFFIIFLIPFLLLNTSCNNQGKNAPDSYQKPTFDSAKNLKKVIYTCEMDTDVRSDTPGVCPKCGMDLIKKVK